MSEYERQRRLLVDNGRFGGTPASTANTEQARLRLETAEHDRTND